jgi:hypothetical protein
MKAKILLTVFLSIVLFSCMPLSISTPTETPFPRGISADIPMYPEHSDVMVYGSGETFSYHAHADLQTVSQFYQTEMVSQGWIQAQEPITYATEIILHYKKANQKVIIDMIHSNDFTAVGISLAP